MKTFILKRKQILIFFLTLTLCAAVGINWYFTNNSPVEIEEQTEENQQNLGEAKLVSKNESKKIDGEENEYFTKAKLKRDSEFDETKEFLSEILTNKESGKTALNDAEAKLNSLIDKRQTEIDCENIIDAKLNCSSIAVIGEKTCEIIIPDELINDASALQIKEIITSKTDISPEKISIIGIKTVVEN